MFNQNMLKAKIIENGFSIIKVCEQIGICEATFYRKIIRNGDFSRSEIAEISKLLNLTDEERNNIFFKPKLTKT